MGHFSKKILWWLNVFKPENQWRRIQNVLCTFKDILRELYTTGGILSSINNLGSVILWACVSVSHPPACSRTAFEKTGWRLFSSDDVAGRPSSTDTEEVVLLHQITRSSVGTVGLCKTTDELRLYVCLCCNCEFLSRCCSLWFGLGRETTRFVLKKTPVLVLNILLFVYTNKSC